MDPDDRVDPGSPVGFWVRAGAIVIDGFLLGLVYFGFAFGAVQVLGLTPKAMRSDRAFALFLILVVAVQGAYFTVLTGLSGQTIGKMAAGIRVVTKQGRAVGYLRSLWRWGAYILSSLSLGLGFLLVAFNRRRRGLHDFVSGTRVVYLPGVGQGRKALMASLGVFYIAVATVVGILSAVAGPIQEQYLATLGREGQAMGNLKALRSVVALYRAERGRFPATLEDLAQLEDFTLLPTVELPGHEATNRSVVYRGVVKDGQVDPSNLLNSGGWGYDPLGGSVFVDSTHTDSKGVAWYKY